MDTQYREAWSDLGCVQANVVVPEEKREHVRLYAGVLAGEHLVELARTTDVFGVLETMVRRRSFPLPHLLEVQNLIDKMMKLRKKGAANEYESVADLIRENFEVRVAAEAAENELDYARCFAMEYATSYLIKHKLAFLNMKNGVEK